MSDNFSGTEQMEEVEYDALLMTAGPWTNSLLSGEVTQPPLSQLPLVVSNEQTQDFEVRCVSELSNAFTKGLTVQWIN